MNNSNFLHVMTLGNNGRIEREAGAPKLGDSRGPVTMPRGKVYWTRPWNTPGTYHLTCTLHTGMNLTVVSSPLADRGVLSGDRARHRAPFETLRFRSPADKPRP